MTEYHFQKSEPLLHSLSLSQPAVERAVYDLIMILSTRLFSLEMVWNLSIFDFLALFIHFFYLARAVIRSWLVSAAGTHAVLQVVTWMLSSHHHSAPCTSWACSASSGPLLHRGRPCGTSAMSLLTCVFVGCYPQNVVPQLYELWTVLVTQLCPTLRPHRL